MATMKQKIRSALRNKFGIEINRATPTHSPTVQLVASLLHFKIDLVIDIGANQGQFVKEIRGAGYSGRVVSFEPLADAYNQLLRASAGDRDWDIYPRCALGDRNGEIEINVAGNSVSSSVLPMLESHRNAAPESAYISKELVEVKTLDLTVAQYVASAENPFLKIDTQGFEWQVLDGARSVLPHIRGIILELSMIKLYEGQHLWKEMVDRLESEGFFLWALQQVFVNLDSGQTYQMNGIFFREPLGYSARPDSNGKIQPD